MIDGLIALTLAISIVVLIVEGYLLKRSTFNFKTFDTKQNSEPFVSILISVRNEEDTIARCLDAMRYLKYPVDKFEVLIGNDHSADQTEEIIKTYTNENLKLIPLRDDISGKAQVLGQLAEASKGEYLYFTDADVEVSKDWIHSLLAAFNKDVGIVCGVTSVKTTSWFSSMQNFDWLYSIGLLKVSADTNVPLTAIGNNMAVSREAYQMVGGFEGIPFSLTEDYGLFREITGKGFQTKFVYTEQSKNTTLAEKSLGSLLRQRKRWMLGARSIPLPYRLILMFQACYFSLVIFLGFYNSWMLALVALRIFLRGSLITVLCKKIKEPINYLQLLFFEFYTGVISLAILLYYLLPIKQSWRGRIY